MQKLYDTQLPSQDLFNTFRLYSNSGIYYFGKNEDIFFDKSMINHIDIPIRILCDLSNQLGCRVGSFYCGIENNKNNIKEMWNNIKLEERQIRTNGLMLRKIDGTLLEYKDPSYRVYWPSFESFAYEYPKSSTKAWLCMDIPLKLEQQRNIIRNRTDIFDASVTSENKQDNYERFNFLLDSGDLLVNTTKWRRITEGLVSILTINSEIFV